MSWISRRRQSFSVEKVLAFAGAEEAPGNDDFALLRSFMEFAAANFENNGLRPFSGCLRFRRTLVPSPHQ